MFYNWQEWHLFFYLIEWKKYSELKTFESYRSGNIADLNDNQFLFSLNIVMT